MFDLELEIFSLIDEVLRSRRLVVVKRQLTNRQLPLLSCDQPGELSERLIWLLRCADEVLGNRLFDRDFAIAQRTAAILSNNPAAMQHPACVALAAALDDFDHAMQEPRRA